MQVQFEIKRIDLWSLFKIAFILYAVIGVIVGIFMFFFSLIVGSLGSAFTYEEEFRGFPLMGGAVGFLLIPFLAFLYGVVGSVFVTIGGWIFNIICGVSGGLRFAAETYDVTPRPPVHPYQSPPPSSGQEPPFSSGSGGNPQTAGPD